jgi:hypothetical protein
MSKRKISNKIIGRFMSLLILSIFTTIIGGFVTMYLWNNIVAVTFKVITLNFWQALGLELFSYYLTSRVGVKDDGYTNFERLANVFSKILVALTIGWVIIQFL